MNKKKEFVTKKTEQIFETYIPSFKIINTNIYFRILCIKKLKTRI